jgi:hypothetical protein
MGHGKCMTLFDNGDQLQVSACNTLLPAQCLGRHELRDNSTSGMRDVIKIRLWLVDFPVLEIC